jgi:hypothetical protein
VAYTYRASTSAGNASGGSLTVNKPTGTVDGDLLIVTFYLESDTNTFDTVPTGWNTGGSIANTGAFKIWSFWKLASGEGASWAWVPHTSAWRAAVCAAYSGGSGSGSFVDVTGTGGQADGAANTSQTAPSVTTVANNDIVVYHYGNYNGDNQSGISGFATNLRISFGSATISDATKTPAGATGTSWPTTFGAEDYAAIHMAYLLTGAGGGGTAYTETSSIVGTAQFSGADVFTMKQTSSMVMGDVESGADKMSWTDAGAAIMSPALSGPYAYKTVETGSATLGVQLSGPFVYTPGGTAYTEASAIILGAALSGAFAYINPETSALVLGAALSGADRLTWTDTGSAVMGVALSGPFVYTGGGTAYTEASSIIMGAQLSGADKLTWTDTSTAVMGEVISQRDQQAMTDTGAAVLGIQLSGPFVYISGGGTAYTETSSIIMGLLYSAYDVAVLVDRGTATMGAAISGDAIVIQRDSGSIVMGELVSGADLFVMRDTVSPVMASVLSGTDRETMYDSGAMILGAALSGDYSHLTPVPSSKIDVVRQLGNRVGQTINSVMGPARKVG